MKCGLLGETLGHSLSPQIHKMLGDYEYQLYSVAKPDLHEFLERREFDGLNVTIPYKVAVIDYCSQLSERAAAIGSVNTLIKQPDGTLRGDNTDYFGLKYLLRYHQIEITGKKALVLGSGGASRTAKAVLLDMGAAQVVVISRKGPDNYEQIDRHSDAQVVVNTTPVGMYPDVNAPSILRLQALPRCTAVVDMIYNPLRTDLLNQARQRGIYYANGMSMLVAQAFKAAELFTGQKLDENLITSIMQRITRERHNICSGSDNQIKYVYSKATRTTEEKAGA